MTIEQAKQVLRDNGYYVDNLWQLDDVKLRHDVDDDTAYEILDSALTHEWIIEQIFYIISDIAEQK